MSQIEEKEGMHTPPVMLAREAIVAYVAERRVLALPPELPPLLRKPSAAFVSLKEEGELRGCIGTVFPVYPTLGEEIIQNAIAAATRDPRFLPVQVGELRRLAISVDVLSAPEPAAGLADFDPQRYGMILSAGGRRGLLLPNLEGVDTVEAQYQIVCRKAGIMPGEPVEFFRFTVERYH